MRNIVKIFVILMMVGLWSCNKETKVQSVSLDQEEMVLAIGETRQIELTIEPLSAAIYNPKHWKSSDENVAIVDQKGNVTGVYGGTCVITATVDDKKATCVVRVETPTYDLNMDKAVVFNNGIDSETGNYVKIVRLFEEGLEIDSVGNATGNGLMLSLHLFSPSTQEPLVEGVYELSESGAEFTVKPGEMIEREGASYATGSFLGEYSDYGFGVLFVKEGKMTVSRDGDEYKIECVMDGAMDEHVEVNWTGKPVVYRADTTYETEILRYNRLTVFPIEIDGENMTGHAEIVMECQEARVRVVVRVPKTADGLLMDGVYSMSSAEKNFTAVAGECFIGKEGEKIDLVNVALTVKDGVLKGSLVDGLGRSYSIDSKVKKIARG